VKIQKLKESKITLLVVGGTGFIGRNVVAKGILEGWEVHVLSMHHQNWRNAREKIAEHHFGDIRNPQEIEKLRLKDYHYDYIVNCAGYVDHHSFWDGGINVVNQHFNGLVNILNNIDKESIKGFVQIGTSDEYGTAKAPQKEKLREYPISPYAAAKTAATHLLQMLHKTENFPAKIVRIFLAYGPDQSENRFLPQIIMGCLNGDSFPVSEGKQLRDFCYVSDVVDGILLCLMNEKANGEVINIASGQPATIKSVIDRVVNIIGGGDPQYGRYPYRKNENMELYASIEKAKALLGWTPKVGLESGLVKTIEYYKSKFTRR